MARIEVEDNGEGIAFAEVAWRGCSTPFFTTRPVGQGDGLGVSGSATPS
jgi:C4-dicarboxylate-specific signal transduction histidine kinase